MQITFGLQKSSQGLGLLPWYNFDTWHRSEFSRERVVYRPGMRTFLPRVGIAVLLALLLFWGNRTLQESLAPPRSSITPQMQSEVSALEQSLITQGLATQEDLEAARRERTTEAERASAEAARRGTLLRSVLQGLVVVVSLLLLMPAAVCLWNRVVLEITPRGTLRVSTRVLWTRSADFSFPDFAALEYGAEEVASRDKAGRVIHSFWQWRVRLMPTADSHTKTAPVTFVPWRQGDRPGAQPRPPRAVAELIGWLHNHSKLPVLGPIYREARSGPRGLANVTTHVSRVPVSSSSASYNSLEEMPPEIRERVRNMLGGRSTGPGQQAFVLQDESGEQVTYHSLEEMSPEVRARFEAVLREGRRRDE